MIYYSGSIPLTPDAKEVNQLVGKNIQGSLSSSIVYFEKPKLTFTYSKITSATGVRRPTARDWKISDEELQTSATWGSLGRATRDVSSNIEDELGIDWDEFGEWLERGGDAEK